MKEGQTGISVGRISQMRKSQPCCEASASSAGAPQHAQRQIGFYPPKATAESPQRDPRRRPRVRRRTLVRKLRVPSPKMGAA